MTNIIQFPNNDNVIHGESSPTKNDQVCLEAEHAISTALNARREAGEIVDCALGNFTDHHTRDETLNMLRAKICRIKAERDSAHH